MKKLVRYGLLLLVVSLIGLSVLNSGAAFSYANEEEVVTQAMEEESILKTAAIKAANDAIRKIPSPALIVSYEQDFIDQVAMARALVEFARSEFEAEDKDFPELGKLKTAIVRVDKMLSIKEAQNAIDLIPPVPELTAEHRPIVEHARELVDFAMLEYGATAFDICWRYDKLREAEAALPEAEEPEPEPEPKPKPDDRIPTPPTGGLSGLLALGAGMSGAGLLAIRRRRGKH